MLDWKKQVAANDYFVNTPCNMAIYMSELMCSHMLENGGIQYYERQADLKSSKLYSLIDGSNYFNNSVPS